MPAEQTRPVKPVVPEVYTDKKLEFYINQFRKMFRKIIVVYTLSGLCVCYIGYKIYRQPELKYFASNESGVLKPLTAYSVKQVERYITANKS
jgi:hypothetical protein